MTHTGGLADALLVAVVLLNLVALGASRLTTIISIVGAQGLMLGGLSLLAHDHVTGWTVAISTLTAAIKGIVIPRVLRSAMRRARIRREVEPFIGLSTSMALGALATGLAIVFSRSLPLRPEDAGSFIVPAALSSVATGFLLLTTRLKAITMIVGYLILENGVFAFGLLLLEAVPYFVEVGVLLDIVVGIFVMGIVVDHISREFSSMDTSHVSKLRD